MAFGGDEVWQPPTEAQLKLFEARRQRSDKISKIMGQYLLKRWKMLSSECELCGTILVQAPGPGGEDYCIGCNEVDSDVSKDERTDVDQFSIAISSVVEPPLHGIIGSERNLTQNILDDNDNDHHQDNVVNGGAGMMVGQHDTCINGQHELDNVALQQSQAIIRRSLTGMSDGNATTSNSLSATVLPVKSELPDQHHPQPTSLFGFTHLPNFTTNQVSTHQLQGANYPHNTVSRARSNANLVLGMLEEQVMESARKLSQDDVDIKTKIDLALLIKSLYEAIECCHRVK